MGKVSNFKLQIDNLNFDQTTSELVYNLPKKKKKEEEEEKKVSLNNIKAKMQNWPSNFHIFFISVL